MTSPALRALALAGALAHAACAGSAPSAPMEWKPAYPVLIEQWKTTHAAPDGLVISAPAADTTSPAADTASSAAGRDAIYCVHRPITTVRPVTTVRFLAEATGLEPSAPAEFFAIGPLSDRAYEALFVSVAGPAALAAACEAIGLPRGAATDPSAARLWPQGEKITVSAKRLSDNAVFRLDELIADTTASASRSDADAINCVPPTTAAPAADTNATPPGGTQFIASTAAPTPAAPTTAPDTPLARPVIYTGGARDAADAVVADTNMPAAVFALYSHGPSLLQLDGTFGQSETYGRFRPRQTFTTGDLFEISLTWDGRRTVQERTLHLTATNAAAVLSSLRADAAAGADLYARLAFDASVTVARAADIARAFDSLDGHGLKMNGAAPGQFFYRAFLPDPAWRNRSARLFQPFEIHLAADGTRTFVFVREDWSGPGDEPVLHTETTVLKDWSDLPARIAATGEAGAKISVVFIFAPPTRPVTDLTPLVPLLSPRIDTFYIFPED